MTRHELETHLASRRDELARLGVESLAVFGSVARGEDRTDSDVDLLVEFSRPVGLFGLVETKAYLERLLDRPVDLGTRGSLKPGMRERVEKEAVYVATGLARAS